MRFFAPDATYTWSAEISEDDTARREEAQGGGAVDYS
jgi:hypothetical protein